jgi:hypothetical protein
MDLSTSGLNLGANFGEHMTELEKEMLSVSLVRLCWMMHP